MAVNAAYIGAGTTLSSNFYIRNFYRASANARANSTRREMSSHELTQADSAALRRAVKSLGRSEFVETQDEDIRNKALAYVETYNHMLSSSSGSSDDQIRRAMKQMKSLTQQYASELDKIGITVHDDGTMESREARLTSASLSKFEKLFSGDSDYMQKIATYSRKIERQSDELLTADAQRRSAAAAKKAAAKQTPDSSSNADPDAAAGTAATSVAQIVAAEMDLDTLMHTGIGNHVNLIL